MGRDRSRGPIGPRGGGLTWPAGTETGGLIDGEGGSPPADAPDAAAERRHEASLRRFGPPRGGNLLHLAAVNPETSARDVEHARPEGEETALALSPHEGRAGTVRGRSDRVETGEATRRPPSAAASSGAARIAA